MRKTKFPSGVTLIELVIVLAISAVLIVIAASTNRSRGRREFDNGMKQLVTEIKTIQNEALSGVGPSTSDNCKDQTEVLDNSGPDPTVCPSGSLFGQAVTFGRVDGTPGSPLFGSVRGAAGENLGKNYLIDNLASTIAIANYFRVRPYRSTHDPESRKIPSNIGYKGSCYTETSNGELPCDFTHNSPNPVMMTFVKYGQSSTGTAVAGTSSIPLQLYEYRDIGFDIGKRQSMVHLWGAGYQEEDQKEVALFFTDTTGKYNAAIHVIPRKGQVNLCFDEADC